MSHWVLPIAHVRGRAGLVGLCKRFGTPSHSVLLLCLSLVHE